MLQQNNTANTVIENTVNNQRKQNKHLGIKEDLHLHVMKRKDLEKFFVQTSA